MHPDSRGDSTGHLDSFSFLDGCVPHLMRNSPTSGTFVPHDRFCHRPSYSHPRSCRGSFVRSTDQAAAFMREHMLQHVDGDATEVLRRLEDVRSAEEAQ